jgi:hypothetical protein
MLAVVGAALALAVAWSAVDLLYFGTQFVLLGLAQDGDAQDWFMVRAFVPAVILREGVLLVVVGWCLYQMSALVRDPAKERGEQPTLTESSSHTGRRIRYDYPFIARTLNLLATGMYATICRVCNCKLGPSAEEDEELYGAAPRGRAQLVSY